jgi:hypothetical protein
MMMMISQFETSFIQEMAGRKLDGVCRKKKSSAEIPLIRKVFIGNHKSE